eukprot:GCRY01004592.1.p1 GENE.GCRY01004592.1~~GCRY01004592.1.p1  ORF type:complete len:126 (-),score=13.03 GCRY01004592.1:291-668(-)
MSSQQRFVLKRNDLYLKILFEFEENLSNFDVRLAKSVLNNALKQCYGVVGGAIEIDVLEVHSDQQFALCHTIPQNFERISAALCLSGLYSEHPCRLTILGQGTSLAVLATSSRDLPEIIDERTAA